MIALLIVLTIVLTACGGGYSTSIVGSWKMTGASGDSPGNNIGMVAFFLLGGNITVSFESNGQYTAVMTAPGQNQIQEGTYSVDGNRIILDGKSGEYKISGKILTMILDGQTMTFERK